MASADSTIPTVFLGWFSEFSELGPVLGESRYVFETGLFVGIGNKYVSKRDRREREREKEWEKTLSPSILKVWCS